MPEASAVTASARPPLALSPGQVEAKAKVKAWLQAALDHEFEPPAPKPEGAFGLDEIVTGDDPDAPKVQPLFKLQGYAGTGKTTIIRALLEDWSQLRVKFGAYTGKAALVMQRNGLPASTIHSMIYKVVPPNKQECEDLFKKIKETDDEGTAKRLRQELKEKQKVRFELKVPEECELSKCDLLVLDECSMVNDDMLADLRTFGVPILALGDPGQLPPIDGAGVLVKGKPDIFLTEIHRQAQDNPIIDFATRARSGVQIPLGAKGGSMRCLSYQLDKRVFLAVDQIITGKNLTRLDINRRVRRMKGFDSRYPVVGDKLICLKNDKIDMIFNGQMGVVTAVGELLDAYVELTVAMESGPGEEPREVKVRALRAYFDAYFDKTALDNVRWWDRKDNHEFDYGYAITCHKAQGSQWDNVLVWDDGMLVWKPAERSKWLYTAITRAAQNIIIAS